MKDEEKNMAEFKIFCNNTADIPEEKAAELGLHIMPLVITIGEESFKNIPIDEFYKKLRDGALPTTSAGNIGEGIEAFEPAVQAGYDVLCLAFSSGLSVTYEAFSTAAKELMDKYPGRKVYVIDTLNASSGEAILIYKAAEMRNEGKSIDEVRNWIEINKKKIMYWLSVDDLDHLKRGGRLSATTAAVGGLLNIKPILHITNDGRLEKADKVRGRNQSYKYMIDKMEKTISNPQEQTVYIPHGDCFEDAVTLKEQILDRINVKNVVIHHLGPVIASHTGAGLIAVIYIGKGRQA